MNKRWIHRAAAIGRRIHWLVLRRDPCATCKHGPWRGMVDPCFPCSLRFCLWTGKKRHWWQAWSAWEPMAEEEEEAEAVLRDVTLRNASPFFSWKPNKESS